MLKAIYIFMRGTKYKVHRNNIFNSSRWMDETSLL